MVTGNSYVLRLCVQLRLLELWVCVLCRCRCGSLHQQEPEMFAFAVLSRCNFEFSYCFGVAEVISVGLKLTGRGGRHGCL